MSRGEIQGQQLSKRGLVAELRSDNKRLFIEMLRGDGHDGGGFSTT
jgi:hypothetical protein